LAEYEVKITELEAINGELIQILNFMKARRDEAGNLVACEAELTTCRDELNAMQASLEPSQNDDSTEGVDSACIGISDLETLRTAIDNGANATQAPTQITLCANATFQLTDETDEISFNQKAVAISCEVPGSCTFDGGNTSRIFNVEGSTASFHGIKFVKGSTSQHMGGAFRFYYADAEISDCFFYKNNAKVRTYMDRFYLSSSFFQLV